MPAKDDSRQTRALSALKALPVYEGWDDSAIAANIKDVLSSKDVARQSRFLHTIGSLNAYEGWKPEDIQKNVSEIFASPEPEVSPEDKQRTEMMAAQIRRAMLRPNERLSDGMPGSTRTTALSDATKLPERYSGPDEGIHTFPEMAVRGAIRGAGEFAEGFKQLADPRMAGFYKRIAEAIARPSHIPDLTGDEGKKARQAATGQLKMLKGGADIGFSALTLFIPEMAAFTQASPFLEKIPGSEYALSPVSALTNPESELARTAAGIGDIAATWGGLSLLHGRGKNAGTEGRISKAHEAVDAKAEAREEQRLEQSPKRMNLGTEGLIPPEGESRRAGNQAPTSETARTPIFDAQGNLLDASGKALPRKPRLTGLERRLQEAYERRSSGEQTPKQIAQMEKLRKAIVEGTKDLPALQPEEPVLPETTRRVASTKEPAKEPLPTFPDPEDAIRFGRANPERIPELQARRDATLAKAQAMKAQGETGLPFTTLLVEAQKDREAIEFAQNPTRKSQPEILREQMATAPKQKDPVDKVIEDPLHTLPEPIADAIKQKAEDLKNEVKGFERTPGRIGVKRDEEGYAFGAWGQPGISNYPDWWNRVGRSKESIVKALEKISKDKGADKGVLVERLKAILLKEATEGARRGKGVEEVQIPPDEHFSNMIDAYQGGKLNEFLKPAEGQEHIVAAAWKNPATGEVHTGKTHPEIYEKLGIEPASIEEGKAAHVQDGFVTNTGRYVDRAEAAKISQGVYSSEDLEAGLMKQEPTKEPGQQDALAKQLVQSIQTTAEGGSAVDIARAREMADQSKDLFTTDQRNDIASFLDNLEGKLKELTEKKNLREGLAAIPDEKMAAVREAFAAKRRPVESLEDGLALINKKEVVPNRAARIQETRDLAEKDGLALVNEKGTWKTVEDPSVAESATSPLREGERVPARESTAGRLYSGFDPGVEKFIAEDVKPAATKAVEAGKALLGQVRAIPDWVSGIFQPAFPAIKKYGKDPYASVIKAIHTPEAELAKFGVERSTTFDKNFDELEKYFEKMPHDEMMAFNLARGNAVFPESQPIQTDARGMLLQSKIPREQLLQAVQEGSDYWYKFAKQNGVELEYFEDYFYGNWEPQAGNKATVENFVDQWKRSERWMKQKAIPTIADGYAWGLKLKKENPITNLKQEGYSVAQKVGLKRLHEEMIDTNAPFMVKVEPRNVEGTPQEEFWPKTPMREDRATELKRTASLEQERTWQKLNDRMFAGYLFEPTYARFVNSLLSTNKISGNKFLAGLRSFSYGLQQVKFVGSVFHLANMVKHSVAATAGGVFDPRGYANFVSAFKKADMTTPEYREYLRLGGGHKYSIEVQAMEGKARETMRTAMEKLRTGNALGAAIRLPKALLESKWILATPGQVKWMFDDFIPTLKYERYNKDVALKEKQLKRALTDGEKIEAIRTIQEFYGEMNERLYGRSGTVTSLLRLLFMAPGYGEGNFRVLFGAGEGLAKHGAATLTKMLPDRMRYRPDEGLGRGTKAGKDLQYMLNSVLMTASLATVGTLAFTGNGPRALKRLSDVRDAFKIRTGQKDGNGDDVYVDLMTFDKDFWSIYGQALTGRPGEIVPEVLNRTSASVSGTWKYLTDISTLIQGGRLTDYRGQPVYYRTDSWDERFAKTVRRWIDTGLPISANVFGQTKQKGSSTVASLATAVAGLRPSTSERVKAIKQVKLDLFDMEEKKRKTEDELGRMLAENPEEAEKEVDKFNLDAQRKVDEIRKEYPDAIEDPDDPTMDDKFLIDVEKLRYRISNEEGTSLNPFFTKGYKDYYIQPSYR